MTLLSIAGFLMMMGGMVTLIIAGTMFTGLIPVIVAQVGAIALMLWARRTFGRRSFHLGAAPTGGGLVTSGPYRFIRHPIYAAICLVVWAATAGSPSALSLSCAVLVTVGAAMRIFAEERLLVARYPEYAAYSRDTKRMIPFVF